MLKMGFNQIHQWKPSMILLTHSHIYFCLGHHLIIYWAWIAGFMNSETSQGKGPQLYILHSGRIHLIMADGLSSFWGPVTSPEWCEKNYVYSSYIAEFFNTISNIPCILLALIGLINALRQRFEKRFSILHLSNMTLAIGSMIYHATLQRV